jgi:hypothetical protein
MKIANKSINIKIELRNIIKSPYRDGKYIYSFDVYLDGIKIQSDEQVLDNINTALRVEKSNMLMGIKNYYQMNEAIYNQLIKKLRG